jgi:hypothetical protein
MLRRIVTLFGLLVMFGSPCLTGQVLCSWISTVQGWGQYVCLVPNTTFNVNVQFTVGENYTQPASYSPPQYTKLQTVTDSGQAVCQGPSPIIDPALPRLDSTVNLTGSGTDYSTYKHVWQGIVYDAAIVYGVIGWPSKHYTFPVSASAYNCCR